MLYVQKWQRACGVKNGLNYNILINNYILLSIFCTLLIVNIDSLNRLIVFGVTLLISVEYVLHSKRWS